MCLKGYRVRILLQATLLATVSISRVPMVWIELTTTCSLVPRSKNRPVITLVSLILPRTILHNWSNVSRQNHPRYSMHNRPHCICSGTKGCHQHHCGLKHQRKHHSSKGSSDSEPGFQPDHCRYRYIYSLHNRREYKHYPRRGDPRSQERLRFK